MVISEKSRRSLQALGLSAYEIKAYTTLLENGSLTASEASRQSTVPYSKIYEVMSSLERKGWVEADDSRPSKFYPKHPSTALETMKLEFESEWRQNENLVLSELGSLYSKIGEREKPEIWIVRGKYNILSKIKEIVNNCEKELLVVLPDLLKDYVPVMVPVLNSLNEKDVQVMLLMDEKTNTGTLEVLGKIVQIRLRKQMFGGGVIADSKGVVLLLGGDEGSGQQLAISAEHVGLAKLARNYFEYLWDDSTTYH